MNENQDQKLNPTCLLLVTAVSFALFALVIDYMDGQHIGLLWWISRASFLLAALTATFTWINKATRRTNEDID